LDAVKRWKSENPGLATMRKVAMIFFQEIQTWTKTSFTVS
jgi:hypothetical protein